MMRPRCGVGDWGIGGEVIQVELGHRITPGIENRVWTRNSFTDDFFRDYMDLFHPRLRPYDQPGSRWRSLSLTYRVSQFPPTDIISKEQVMQQIREAFAMWASMQRSLGSLNRAYPGHIYCTWLHMSLDMLWDFLIFLGTPPLSCAATCSGTSSYS